MTTTATDKKDAAAESSSGKKDVTAKSLMEAIEEDDEFEEFEPAHWAPNQEEAEDVQQRQDNWDDAMDDDFTKNLQEELAKNSDGATPSPSTSYSSAHTMSTPSPSGKDVSIEATNTVDTAASTVGESPPAPTPTKSTSHKFETPAPTKQLFKNAGYSPPEDFETVRQLPTPDEAQEFYEYYQVHSNSPAWGDLSFRQQAKLVWLNIRGHDDWPVDNLDKILKNIPSNYEVATVIDLITHTLDPSTPIGSRLDRVMQKGGDKSSSVLKTGVQRLETILENYPHWVESAPTIFNGGYMKKVTPFYRIQVDNSSLCYLIAPSSAIFYRFSMPDKPLDELGYVVNINRYVRNIFHSDRSFKYIFLGAGGYSGEALFDFLEASNEGKLEHDLTLRIDLGNALYKNDLSRLFNDLKDTLFHYGPAVVRIRVFQELLDYPGQVEWSGSFQEKKELDKKKHPHDGHALLMVGVRLTPDEHGGIQFLLQNSWSSSMWFIFGLDLLRSMGEAHEQLVFIRQGVKYERKPRDSFKFAGRNAESWSPSAAASVEMVEDFGDFEMSGGPHSHPSIHKPNYTMADQEGLLDEDIITSGNFVVET